MASVTRLIQVVKPQVFPVHIYFFPRYAKCVVNHSYYLIFIFRPSNVKDYFLQVSFQKLQKDLEQQKAKAAGRGMVKIALVWVVKMWVSRIIL